ncbi:GMC family oxidoreductase [Mesorhizobium mediterraneum]|uniref:Alanine-phosphoribitol ligase n=1 Tax=Mesorhizobium mediterraneum TaxID=43617 RepID=A0AB36QZR7_9HYPH|nr:MULTISPECIES: GMC family oxidoreductase [Mesorhizobium]TGU88451.1 GMC family oxidoreductase [Mesorhizobium sp. M00.F.Ca.ET.151.01.1.1]TGV56113.1 GMC family oxidoreductase [bacterium M00.F.Ca.ET.141.01.1.1]PAP97937.1 alanine-phosphoribitol ligase [Mesorhizobium mediterraneum]RUW81669.1 GMC family oxidoreductase [Mesorhizobium sp. M2A.F.Ca.ET.067.02.1.1]RWB85662.1 MAG: GMC family oxidoreductase [Mesorhizobium sp.]
MVFDYIVIGGGSSGSVVASRLSADGHRVLLIEAGPDTPPNAVPDDILEGNPTRAYFNPDYQWPLLDATTVRDGRKPIHYEQARVMGGGSSINAQVANRGGPEDYNDWASSGAAGWSWEEVLPYFRRLECDLDFGGEFHGKAGPLPIRRVRRSDWSGFIRAVSRAYENEGIHFRPDFNGGFGDGYSVVPLTNRNGHRVSAAMAYLSESVRSRRNLTILPATTVVRLAFSGRTVTGVETENNFGQQSYLASSVILCAGAVHSPTILMRSGVGPAEQLTNLGIPVVADVRGVGQNLQEHPGIAVSAYLKPSDRMAPNVSGHIQMHARYSSGYNGCPSTDMAISGVAKSAWHPLGKRLGSLYLWVNRVYSTGTIVLKDRSHTVEPQVDFNWLSDKRDADRLKHGFCFMARLLKQDSLSAVALDPFPSAWNARAKQVSKVNCVNYGLTSVLALLMDSSPRLRRALISHVITDGHSIADLIKNEEHLDRFVRQNVTGNWHPTSSCKIGQASDPAAVTDPSGRVRGVSGLRIADASVMPFCPRANTNIPTIMVAEKMADAILKENRESPAKR